MSTLIPHLKLSRRRLVAGSVVLAVGLTACGSGSESTPDDPTQSSVASEPTAETPAAGPERIISLSPTATEILFAIGAGDRVVAVDDQSDFPEGVPTTDLSGFTPNIEAIATYEPDLVVAAADPGDLVSGLEALGIEVLLQTPPDTLEGGWDQMIEVGEAVGSGVEAAALVADLQGQAAEILASVTSTAAGLTYYHELDPTFYSVTSGTFIGDVYAEFGLVSIGEGADSPYPQLSAESIIESNPDIIFLADADCCGESTETLSARPGWDSLSAVAAGTIVELDEDVSSRWGPRIVEFMQTIADVVSSLEA